MYCQHLTFVASFSQNSIPSPIVESNRTTCTVFSSSLVSNPLNIVCMFIIKICLESLSESEKKKYTSIERIEMNEWREKITKKCYFINPVPIKRDLFSKNLNLSC